MLNGIRTNMFSKLETKNQVSSDKLDKKVSEMDTKGAKQKLSLALKALAVAGMATVGTVYLIKKGKLPSELSIDKFKKIGNFDKGKAIVKGKPYTGTINVVNKKGSFILEYVDGLLKSSNKWEEGLPRVRKLYSEQNGIKIVEKQGRHFSCTWRSISKTTIQDGKIEKEFKTLLGKAKKVAERNNDTSWTVTQQIPRYVHYPLHNGLAVDTINLHTGEVIDSKITRAYTNLIKGEGGLVRKTINEINDAGNKVRKTYKNGYLAAEAETILRTDGSKRIVINYPKHSRNRKLGVEIIDIAKDGTKTITKKASRYIHL